MTKGKPKNSVNTLIAIDALFPAPDMGQTGLDHRTPTKKVWIATRQHEQVWQGRVNAI
jgi:hypothetical protein